MKAKSPKRYPAEESIIDLGLEIFQQMKGKTPSVFKKDFWSGKMMDLSMKDPAFKVEMFRFVDVFPSLRNDVEVAAHLQEYFCRPDQDFPTAFQWGLGRVAPEGKVAKLAASQIRKQMTSMAKRFIAGTDAKSAAKLLESNWNSNVGFTLDLLGEATVSEQEAKEYAIRYDELLESLIRATPQWTDNPQLERASWGRVPRVNVSIKASSLYSQIDPLDHQGSINAICARLRPLFRKAMKHGAFVHIDMEQYDYKDLTIALFKQILMEDEFRTFEHAGIAIQTYLRDTPQDLQDLIVWAKNRGTPVTVRLIKGAYWDSETIISEQQGWASPVWSHKWETDACYESCTRMLLDHTEVIRPAFGTHNVRSIAHIIAYARTNGVPDRAYEFQMLYGMAEPIKIAVQSMGFRLREYVPIGEMIPGMAYLVRRLLENTSNEGWLKQSSTDELSPRVLLANPDKQHLPLSRGTEHLKSLTLSGFRNHPLFNFAMPQDRQDIANAIRALRKQLHHEYPLVIDGKPVRTSHLVPSINPSKTSEILGKVHFASEKEVDAAVVAAKRAFVEWSHHEQATRSAWVMKLADRLAKRRTELSAWMVLEVGKNWREADADVCEAIDFCRYYALEMLERSQARQHGNIAGELNLQWFQPKGVSAIIAPWNFPLAILTGMTIASVTAGNTAIMKPAEQSSIIAAKLMECVQEVGFPPGVIQYLPGHGETVGAALVAHPDVHLVAFTGSMNVGLQIQEVAHKTSPDPRFVKKVVCEMGGKNAIIVDSDADLDEAIKAVVHSAFGFQGQKCSACSRVIVDQLCYDEFRSRLVRAIESLEVGPSDLPQFGFGPVIDQEAAEKIVRYIDLARKDGSVIAQAKVPKGGFFVPPTLVEGLPEDHPIAQEEVFGPLLLLIKANDFEHALEVANNTRFALTGALFTRSPSHIERCRDAFRVGNLYINRGCTGALVYRQPFGGFNMSGTGSKTGGPEYLLHFLEPRSLTENTMRRGFSPETV